jgi:hypothetical protein
LSEQKLFQVFVNKLEFDPGDFIVSNEEHELVDSQKKIIDSATLIMKENLVGEIKSYGGNLKVNDEKFKEIEKKANEELENEEYEGVKKELKTYIKKLRNLIEKSCVAIIPVKEMPWVDVLFRTVPRIVFDKKVELIDTTIAYYGETKCEISRPVVLGKMKNEKPLFAPITGRIDLGGYKLDESQKGPKSQIYSYVSEIIKSFESTLTRNHLAKYHEGFQRHGDPICDFLMKDNELMNAIGKLISGIESGRLSSDISVCGIAVPHPDVKSTLLVVVDEGKDPNQFSRCFEALLRFSAESCNVPTQQAQTSAQSATQPTGTVRTSGGQELKVWSAEELTSEAQKRMESQPAMAEWTEEELKKFTEERGTSLPEGMEVWTEEDLQDLAKKRQGGLDIPEWEPDKEMNECAKCGYALRPGWSKCPVCETPVGAKIEPEASQKPSVEPDDKSEAEPSELPKDDTSDEPKDKPPQEVGDQKEE